MNLRNEPLGYEEWIRKYIGNGPKENIELMAKAIAIWEKHRNELCEEQP
jgi:hypothetical protein